MARTPLSMDRSGSPHGGARRPGRIRTPPQPANQAIDWIARCLKRRIDQPLVAHLCFTQHRFHARRDRSPGSEVLIPKTCRRDRTRGAGHFTNWRGSAAGGVQLDFDSRHMQRVEVRAISRRLTPEPRSSGQRTFLGGSAYRLFDEDGFPDRPDHDPFHRRRFRCR